MIARSGDAVHSTTADGVDGASISGRVLTNPRSVAYSPTRSIVQNYRPRSRLVRFPDGVAGRFAISAPYGAVTTIHPDGDALTLLDTRRGSATYGRVVGKVTTLDPDGRTAYVSQGGDGEIVVVDLTARKITATIDTPTALNGGGYLTVIKRGTPVTDLVAR